MPFLHVDVIRSYWFLSRRIREMGFLMTECSAEEDAEWVVNLAKLGPHREAVEDLEREKGREEVLRMMAEAVEWIVWGEPADHGEKEAKDKEEEEEEGGVRVVDE
jgi:hypothetical protein